jgi:hypothetical protein
VEPAGPLIRSLRPCLLKSITEHSNALYCSRFFFFFFFFFLKFFNNNKNQKNPTFFTFYITSIIFYYYSNKKIHYNTNFFTFLYKFFLLYITSLLFTHFKINNPLLCTVLFCNITWQTSPKIYGSKSSRRWGLIWSITHVPSI